MSVKSVDTVYELVRAGGKRMELLQHPSHRDDDEWRDDAMSVEEPLRKYGSLSRPSGGRWLFEATNGVTTSLLRNVERDVNASIQGKPHLSFKLTIPPETVPGEQPDAVIWAVRQEFTKLLERMHKARDEANQARSVADRAVDAVVNLEIKAAELAAWLECAFLDDEDNKLDWYAKAGLNRP